MPFRHRLSSKSPRFSQQSTANIGLHTDHFQTYYGQWFNHEKHGYGKLIDHRNQSIYEGEFVHNEKNGHGRLTRPDQNGSMQRYYIGQWKNNQMNGLGTLYSNPSEYYEGKFVKNKKSGWGRMFYENGDIYEGYWLNHQRHGFGLLLKVNGDRYEGQWFENQKHGFGRYYFAKQMRLFQGIWLNDMCKSAEQQQHDETSASQKNLTMNDISNDHGLVIGTDDDDDATAAAVTEKEKKRRQAYARAAN